VWCNETHAHIEVKAVDQPGSEELAGRVERALERVRGVRWAKVNPVLGRVVIALDAAHGETPPIGELVDVVAAVENASRVGDDAFPLRRPEHPADTEPIRRAAIALGADTLALGASVFGMALQLSPIPTELASVVSMVENEPRLRNFLEHRVGVGPADLGLGIANAFAQAVGQGPLSLAVDITRRANELGELVARHQAWERREPWLEFAPSAEDVPAVSRPARPAPLDPGPVERYADLAAIGSLGAFGATLALTRSPRRAAAFLVASLPKAARHGREAFCAHLGREISKRDAIVMDARALRRLDRVRTVVLDADVVQTGKVALGQCEVLGNSELDEATACSRISSLFDPSQPRHLRRRGAWACAPVPVLRDAGVRLPRGATTATRRQMTASAGRGSTRQEPLGLAKDGTLVAVAPMVPVLDPMAPPLADAAKKGGLEVVLAGGTTALARSLGADRRVAGGRRLRSSVRALQEEGGGVLLISGGSAHGALESADVSVGIPGHAPQPPWGADIITGPGLLHAYVVVEAAAVAGRVSAMSALIGLAGSAVGGAWAIAGPAIGAGGRAAVPMNVAALAAQANGVGWAEAVKRRPAPRARAESHWHAMDPDAVLRALHSSADGLARDVARRRSAGTRKEPPSPARRAVNALASELANPLTPVLAAGAALSAAVGSVSDAGLVAGVTAANAFIGAAQRVRADVSIERLARVADAVVEVIRPDGPEQIDRRRLVPGDVVALSSGEVVPADLRIIMATACEADESALTGESMPVPKHPAPAPGAVLGDRHCMLYEGTTVSSGTALAVVVAVGDDTEVGRSLADAPEPPPSGVEARLATLTSVTLPATFAAGAAVTGLSIARGRSPRRAIGSGVGLTVAAVPEGLPLLATTAQQASARRLAGRGALVRNPRTIEALGRVNTLCFDKTGTLTLGEIALQCVSDGAFDEPIDALGERTRRVLAAALRASPATNGNGVESLPHATDRAVVAGAERADVEADEGANAALQSAGELPFEPARGFHAVVAHADGSTLVSVKGAPEVVLPRCRAWRRPEGSETLDTRVRRQLDGEVERLARKGLRVLAVAERVVGPEAGPGADTERSRDGGVAGDVGLTEDGVRDLELFGFVALADSVRPTAAAAVSQLRDAGVDVVMITGDHPMTAGAIARELGILNGHRVVSGPELDQMSDEELDGIITDVSVFARVTPTDKVRIVRAFQRAERVVAMTGDGANDAPAIRLAQAGIALGRRSSPAAKEAADLVVVDDRMETILDAIVEGRSMWLSVRDALAILVGGNVGEVGFSLLTTAVAGASPLGARQFLLVNLLTDMLPAMAIALRTPVGTTPESLLKSGPDQSLGPELVRQIALRAGTTTAGATVAWLLARLTGRGRRASTVALAALIGTQLGQTAVVGRDSPFVLASTAASAAVLVGMVETPGVSRFFGCTPLGPVGWGIAAGSAAAATGASVFLPRAVARVRAGGVSAGPRLPRPQLGSGPTPGDAAAVPALMRAARPALGTASQGS